VGVIFGGDKRCIFRGGGALIKKDLTKESPGEEIVFGGEVTIGKKKAAKKRNCSVLDRHQPQRLSEVARRKISLQKKKRERSTKKGK